MSKNLKIQILYCVKVVKFQRPSNEKDKPLYNKETYKNYEHPHVVTLHVVTDL